MPRDDRLYLQLLREKPLDAMTHGDLVQLRAVAPSQFEQEVLAPREHKAFAREVVRESPWSAPGVAVSIPAYYLAKALRGGGRTAPSMDQVFGGFEGVHEGLQAAIRDVLDRYQK